MKTLFINLGVYAIYGATRSLSELTRYWPDKFDMIVPLTFPEDLLSSKEKTHLIKVAHESYGANLDQIFFVWLPTQYPLDVEYRDTIKWKIKHTLIFLLGLLNKRKIYQMIEREHYDFIHLNSIILYPLLTKKYPMYIHVREIVNRYSRKVAKKLELAKGVIFIDYANQVPFSQCIDRLRSTVLINPFDMSRVKEVDCESVRKQYGIEDNETVYMIAGNVSAIKGVDFVINAFVHTNICGKLLVVGSGDDKYVAKCKKISSADKRVLFCGEMTDMIPFYAICDYVVRGDAVFGFGRTNYEALYAGKSVITPGDVNNISEIHNYETYRDNIHFYEARNIELLIDAFHKYSFKEIMCKEPIDTSVTYAREFIEFVKD